MTEDAPLEPTAPEPAIQPTDAAPTAPTPATVVTEPGPPPWPTPAATQEPPRPPRGSMVAVPKWLLIVVAALVGAALFAGLGFAIGYEVAPGNEHGHERNAAEGLRPGSGRVPSVPGNGNGSDLPTVPSPAPTPGTSRGAFLGVATSPSANPPGVSIVRVVAGSPAATAGLQPGDVITKLDNDAITTQSQLANRIGAHGQGDAVTITYVRNGTTQTAPVTLAARNAFQLPTPSTTVPQS